jgi:hypothetical protein
VDIVLKLNKGECAVKEIKKQMKIFYDFFCVILILLMYLPLLSHMHTYSVNRFGNVFTIKWIFLFSNIFVGIFFNQKSTIQMIQIGMIIMSIIGLVIMLGYIEILTVNFLF